MTPPRHAGKKPSSLKTLLLVLTIKGGDNSLFLSGFRIRLNCGLDGTTQLCDLNSGVKPHYRSGLTFSLFVVTGTVMSDSIPNSNSHPRVAHSFHSRCLV
jgi:hypothetical protein